MDDASEATVGAVLASFDASIRPSRLVVRQAADMVGGSHLGLRAWSYIVVGSIDSCEVFSPPAAQSERTNNAAHAYRHRRNRHANSDRVRSVDAHCRRPHIALDVPLQVAKIAAQSQRAMKVMYTSLALGAWLF